MSATTVTACPSWCAGTAHNHDFERANGYPVQHFRYVRAGRVSCTVGLTMSVEADGSTSLTVGVESDEYPVDVAEATALAMLEAVRIARTEATR